MYTIMSLVIYEMKNIKSNLQYSIPSFIMFTENLTKVHEKSREVNNTVRKQIIF